MCPHIHKGESKFTTNIDILANMHIDRAEIEKTIANYTFLGQTMAMEKRRRQGVSMKIKARWNVFEKHRELFLDRHIP